MLTQKGLAPVIMILGVMLFLLGIGVGFIATSKPKGPVYSSPLPASTSSPARPDLNEGKSCGYLPVPGSRDDGSCPAGYTCEGRDPGNDAGGKCHKGVSASEKACKDSGGVWSAEFKECTGISKKVCESKGGSFNECASPCRHMPGATMCIQSCAEVCTFLNQKQSEEDRCRGYIDQGLEGCENAACKWVYGQNSGNQCLPN